MEEFCTAFFGTNKCLAMLEDTSTHPHCHVQGELNVTESEAEVLKKEWTQKHYLKKTGKNCHPIKKRKREADDSGFQYMSKDLPNSVVLYKQGLTNEDLNQLYEQSKVYVEEQKSQLGEYLSGRILRESGENPAQLHKRLRVATIEYYMAEDKMCPPNWKNLVLHFLTKHYGTRDVIDYRADI